jgi:hypothetical protein
LLCGIDKKNHGQVAAEIQARFFCPPFDLRACALAAELWQLHESWPKDEKYQDRPLLRADTMIVASASVAGASRFYSHEDKVRDLAGEAGMKAFDLPTHAENFLIDQEIDEEGKE